MKIDEGKAQKIVSEQKEYTFLRGFLWSISILFYIVQYKQPNDYYKLRYGIDAHSDHEHYIDSAADFLKKHFTHAVILISMIICIWLFCNRFFKQEHGFNQSDDLAEFKNAEACIVYSCAPETCIESFHKKIPSLADEKKLHEELITSHVPAQCNQPPPPPPPPQPQPQPPIQLRKDIDVISERMRGEGLRSQSKSSISIHVNTEGTGNVGDRAAVYLKNWLIQHGFNVTDDDAVLDVSVNGDISDHRDYVRSRNEASVSLHLFIKWSDGETYFDQEIPPSTQTASFAGTAEDLAVSAALSRLLEEFRKQIQHY